MMYEKELNAPEVLEIFRNVDKNKIVHDVDFRSKRKKIETRHEISNNVVCATSKGSDQPAHTRSLIRAFASRLSTL